MDYIISCDTGNVLELVKSLAQVDTGDREGAACRTCKLHTVQVICIAKGRTKSVTALYCCLTELSSSENSLSGFN